MEKDFEGIHTEGGYFYSAYKYSAAEHGGTHIDAPVHFARGRNSVDSNPIGPVGWSSHRGRCDSPTSLHSPDSNRIATADFENWEKRYGRIPKGTIVLIRTGFGKFYPDKKKYLGTDERGAAAVKKLHFPGLHPDTARWLVESRGIKAVGLDTASIDYGQSTAFDSSSAFRQERARI